jgi:DNA-binding MltR family transcriptional regulator
MDADDLDDFAAFAEEFQAETERGAALVGAAMIEEMLENMLLAFFADPDVGTELLDPVGGGPLSGMVARAKIALCLGLIDRCEYEECKTISKIRNAFAHWRHGTTFRHPKIAKLCAKLKMGIPTDPKESPRLLYTHSVSLIASGFQTRSVYAAVHKPVIQEWPKLLIEAVAAKKREAMAGSRNT